MHGRIPPLRKLVSLKRGPSMIFLLFIFIFFMGICFILFMRSPLSHINSISVKGNSLLDDGIIIKNSKLKVGHSFFRISSTEAEKQLKLLPEIAAVEVDKDFPNHISIIVKEKPLTAWIRNNRQFFPVLSDGTIIRRQLHVYITSYPKPVFLGWSTMEKEIKAVTEQLAKVPEKITNQLTEIHPVPDKPDRVLFISKKGHRIIARINDIDKKLPYYASFVDREQGNLFLLEGVWFTPNLNTGN